MEWKAWPHTLYSDHSSLYRDMTYLLALPHCVHPLGSTGIHPQKFLPKDQALKQITLQSTILYCNSNYWAYFLFL